MQSFTTLLSIAQNKNYSEIAITAETLGIDGLSAEQFKDYVNTGKK